MRSSPLPGARRTDPAGVHQDAVETEEMREHRGSHPTRLHLVSGSSEAGLIDSIDHDLPEPPLQRLGRRKLVQWTVAYLAVAWLLLQLTDVLSEIWTWPLTLQRAVSLVLGMGLFPAIVIAWFHGEKGRQSVCALEVAIIATLVASTAAVVVYFCAGPSV